MPICKRIFVTLKYCLSLTNVIVFMVFVKTTMALVLLFLSAFKLITGIIQNVIVGNTIYNILG